MSLKILELKKKCFLYQWATISLQLLSGVGLWSLLLHNSFDYLSAEARLNPPTHFWIFPLLPTQPTIRPAACTVFRNIFHNCQLLVSAFIDMQNSFPSPRIHMLNYQITKMPFFKVLICEVSLNWELATKWDLKQLPLLSSATWLWKLFSLTTLGSAWLWILDLKFTF